MQSPHVPQLLNWRVAKGLQTSSRLLAVGVLVIGIAVLAGYATHNGRIVSLSPGLRGMSVLTATSLLLLAGAIAVEGVKSRRLAAASSWLAGALGGIEMFSHALLRRDAIDPVLTAWLFPASVTIAGATSLATAICIVLVAAALLLDRPAYWLASNSCAAVSMIISGLALLGYAYGVRDLYDLGPFRSMAFHTALGLFALSIAAIIRRPEQGWAKILASPLAGGPARRQLLFLVFPPIAGWALMRLAQGQYIGLAMAMALLVIATILPLAVLIFHDALIQDTLDLERRAKLDLQSRIQDDLEDRLAAQAAELASRERLERTLSDVEIVGTWDWNVTADIVIADQRCARLFGVDADAAMQGTPMSNFTSRIVPEDQDRVTREITEAIKTGQRFASEFRLIGADGGSRHVLSRGQRAPGAKGQTLRFPGVVIDINDQRVTERALNESRDRYQSLFESIDTGFCLIELTFDAEGRPTDYRFVEVNPAFERQTGLRDPTGKWMQELLPTNEQYWLDIYGEVAQTGQRQRFENRAAALQNRWYDVLAFPVGDPAGRLVAVLFNDITDRRRMEDALRLSESQFRSLAQAMPNHVWTSLPNGKLDWFNERVFEYSGLTLPDLAGDGWAVMLDPEDLAAAAERWGAALASGLPYETEFRLRRSDGAYRWHIARAIAIRADDGTISRWIGSNTDIDDQKRAVAALANMNATLEDQVQQRTGELMAAEASLRQSQKMEAVGQLTGGIAHDFNNLLTGISGSLELLAVRVAQGRYGDLQRYLHAAKGAATRAAALTHRLLAFSRRQTLDPKATDVNRLVADLDELIRRTVGPAITVETIAAAGLWPTLVDPNQLENAVLNLCINARDAMPDGGRLTLETSNQWLDERAAKDRDLAKGQYVTLCVSDTGGGMPPDVIERAFDPFYTTKPLGEGTGLGLSMVYGFVRQSGGQARIYSEIDHGTMVCLYLPRHFGDVADDDIIADPGDTPRSIHGETVLIVDDEPTVRMLVTEVLEELGYAALEAEDGRTGLRILETKRRIDLLITDVGLPGGMNGRQMADAGLALRPELKILFITGYAENAVLGNGILKPGMHVLTKPFAMEILGNRIKSILTAS